MRLTRRGRAVLEFLLIAASSSVGFALLVLCYANSPSH
jgi:hypothetical protein